MAQTITMVEKDQSRPLAFASPIDRSPFDEEQEVPVFHSKDLQRKKFIVKCCGCCTAVILLLAVFMIVLAFTVFRVKDPVIKIHGITITQIAYINGSLTIPDPAVNIKFMTDVSVKNPNLVSFWYSNTTAKLYYRGNVVGEGLIPPGIAKARRTQRRNVTLEISTSKMILVPGLPRDVESGLVTMNSYTKLGGRLKVPGKTRWFPNHAKELQRYSQRVLLEYALNQDCCHYGVCITRGSVSISNSALEN